MCGTALALGRAVSRLALPLALLVQAALLFSALDRFSPWGDELFTLGMVTRPLGDMLVGLGADVHPPLFFLLARLLPPDPAWQRLPGVIFALASTVALDRLYLGASGGAGPDVLRGPRGARSSVPDRAGPETLAVSPASSWPGAPSSHPRAGSAADPDLRWRTLLLWALSPALLLYAPMARSYSLQVLLVLLAVAGLFRLQRGENGWALALAGLVPLAWTHYLPTLAIGSVALLRGNKQVRIATAIALVSLAPWAPEARDALTLWWQRAGGYLVSGNPIFEHVPRLGWWALTFTVGESSPGDALFGLVLALPFVLLAALRGSWRRPELPLVLLVALVGYVGVARWSSYPFVPARMLFLLPFFVIAVARGLGRTGTAALALLQLVAVGAWIDGSLLNRGYATPHREMAAAITPCDRLIVDTANSDDTALRRYLPPGCDVLAVADDFLAGTGYLMLAWAWCVSSRAAMRSGGDAGFKAERAALAAHGVEWVLPQAAVHWQRVQAGARLRPVTA